ncbi:hypothetical protein [Rhodococcus koreensis]
MSCTWPVDRTCLPDADAPADALKMRAAVDSAVQVLWALTGRQFGCCEVLARPTSLTGEAVALGYAALDAGEWKNYLCSCTGTRVDLDGPVCAVTEIRLGGTVLDPAEYRVEGNRVFRTTGPWPTQDLNLPLGEPGTWSVRYERGVPPPAGAASMVGMLALEFWNACTGGNCKLPRRVQTVARQGVTVQMVDPAEIYDRGATGITEIDLWIAAANPYKHRQPPAVSSPDYPGVI